MIGVLHVSAHLAAALILMLLLELGVEMCIQHKLLGTSGYHTLYQWYRSVESEHFPDPTGLRARIEQWTFGLYPACIKYFMSAFDVPEVPKKWKLDPEWDREPKQPEQMSHLRKFPSKWSASASQQDPLNTVKIVDQFVIRQTDKTDVGASDASVNIIVAPFA
ncbi:hypothetical protein C1H46_044564 [Malus baccata]|uniref:Aminotransferase-like plant mobile domain-containing protein n=1 Tax=Malus baccata TaxID=106549 RepID=A0A540K6P6_MALBA|nr:hypothetical protein C1H46_044564 [Malus baccata]